MSKFEKILSEFMSSDIYKEKTKSYDNSSLRLEVLQLTTDLTQMKIGDEKVYYYPEKYYMHIWHNDTLL